ncbi:hypothetical protein SASPL_150333 [Salvia splendens]|uniref:GED domain-containing protein n=1 Tax=Salvia splendens TaxID=180675 RepID=A0A8X8W5X5_SALSN|nr:hypothetical protein SASPL_150333 [Salvia splendens]
MEAIEELAQLSESMRQASAMLADEDVDETASSSSSSKRSSTFLNVVALGNTVNLRGWPFWDLDFDLINGNCGSSDLKMNLCKLNSAVSVMRSTFQGAGKSAVLNSLIGHPALPTGEGGATRAPICVDLTRDSSLSSKSIMLQIDSKSQAVSASALRHSLQDRLGKASGKSRDEIYLKLRTSTAPPLKLIDLPGADKGNVDDSLALLLNQGPRSTSDIPWVALIGQSVAIASAQSGSVGADNSLENAWRAESESLKSILTGAPQSKLGRLQGKSQVVQDELFRLGEQMVHSSEGTRALALELCREFEDKFLQHITTGEGSGWKVVSSFEGNFPNRIKQLPLDRHFDINNVKRIVLEADGYQPYLISPEKGLRSLIKGVLELAKESSRLCVDEVHRVLVDIVSASANATPGLGRYPPFKREVIAIATTALEGFKNEAKNMVVALVDMERAYVPPQHFIRLVQRRMDRQRREEELKGRSSKKGSEAEQSILNRATSPQTGGNSKSMKDSKSSQQEKDKDKDIQEGSGLKIAGPDGELTAVPRWFVLNGKTGKLGYTKKQEERHFRGVITLEDTMTRRPADPEEELRWMAQEVRGYVEAVLNSLAANVPKAVVLCQVEKAKEDMLFKLYSSISAQSMARIEELLQEDQNVKRRRERIQKQSSILSKLTRQLSIHDNRAAAASTHSNGVESPTIAGPSSGDDWRSAFDAAANGPNPSYGDSRSNGHNRRNSDPSQNGDINPGGRRTPNRLPPAPPSSGSVFGLGHDSLMWTSLNYGGRTVFLEEDKEWIAQIKAQIPSLEAYHVTYDTKVSQADELLEVASREECRAVSDPRFSKCQLALSGFPSEVYDVEWDLIMVDAPTGYFDGAPGRMSAIYTAGLMARNRESGESDVFVHDVDRVVEDKFSKELLCEGYLVEQEGRIRHFNIPSHRTSSGRPFCP